jgi:hypothetical protein
MRAIVGYAPVEPDGSVKVKVPANVPLAIDVLDAEGRRIGPAHLNWFQVQPGDTLNCVGCHTHNTAGATPDVHARADGTAPSINSGLPVGLEFVNTLIPGTSTVYWGAFQDTMAEVRFDRYEDQSPAPPAGTRPQLSPDLIYDDYWTDPALPAPTVPNPGYSYNYAGLPMSIPSPLNLFCEPWIFSCRVVINYQQQIHAIWKIDRGVDLFTPTPPGDPLDMTPNGVGDDTCTECHTTLVGTRVAHGQLDLTDGVSDQEADHFKSYRELLFTDQGEELDAGGALVNIQIPDGMGGLIDDPAAAVNPSMTSDGARSSHFIEKMSGTELDSATAISGLDHSAMLTVHELKLIDEWLDLGAQNFNNPFDPTAPQN